MIKAVIFDMDGVIINSEPLWEKTERILLSRRDIEYNPTYRDKIVGLNQNDSASLLKDTFKLPESIQALIDERVGILISIYEKELGLIPGVFSLASELKETGFLLALASSSPYKVVEFVIDKFSLNKCFQVVVSGDMIELGKPNPDIYLYAAKTLRVNPNECVAIEDSINGVKSAKSAGLFCIAIPDKRLTQKDFQIADLVVDSLNSIDAQVIKSLG
ncbi:MAG: HAD family hydrolase [Thermodesulfobacteriota bacterium]